MVQIGHLFNDIFFHSKLCALQKQLQGAYFTTVENSGKKLSANQHSVFTSNVNQTRNCTIELN